MANIKITDLTAYGDPDSTDVLPIVDVGADVTKKVSVGDLLENAGSGTAALPGIAFDGDSNTGIYRPGDDQLAISTNGTQALYINADGDILVADGNRMEIDEIRARDGDGLKLFDDGGAGIFIKDGGNVGIGISDPSNAKLEISHDSDDEGIRINDNRAAPTVNKRIMDVRYTGANGRTAVGTEMLLLFDNNASSTQPFIVATNNTGGVFTVEQDGSVGIGTPTPAVACDVVGQVRASTGILFGNDTAAANALDDYEEGTFTPAIEGATSSGTGTYSAQIGRYVKIGKQVTVWIRLTWSAHTGTGNGKISGLPFPSQAIAGGKHPFAATIGYELDYDVAANTVLSAYVEPNSARISLAQVGVGTQSGANLAALDTAAGVTISATYETA